MKVVFTWLYIQAIVFLAVQMIFVQLRHHFQSIQSRIIRQDFRNQIQWLRKLDHCILIQSGLAPSKFLDLSRQLNLRRRAATDQARVFCKTLERIHTIVTRSLILVQHRVRPSPEHDRAQLTLSRRILLENHHALAPNLLHTCWIDVPQFIRQGGLQLGDGGGARHTAQPSQIEFGRDLDGHHLVFLDEVQRHLADGLITNQQLGAGTGDALYVLFELVLLT